MAASTRLQSLEQKHAQLDARLHVLMTRPYWDSLETARIKREKLVLKEVIETLKEEA